MELGFKPGSACLEVQFLSLCYFASKYNINMPVNGRQSECGENVLFPKYIVDWRLPGSSAEKSKNEMWVLDMVML